MRTIHWLALGVLTVAACYSDASQMSTIPSDPSLAFGPPGGGADPYPQQQPVPQNPSQNPYDQDPSIYQQPTEGFQQPADGDLAQLPDGQGDPSAVAGAADPMADVGDGEIDTALAPYGSWTDDPDYGRVWRPDPTQVGMDFTPYETGGGWVDSDYGWAFDTTYAWGWLPFHYGNWGWIGGSWGWCPGHHWGAAWVDWRHGGGYVGWRPQPPLTRDHRTGHVMDSHWRFAGEHEFGNSRNIRAHLFNNPAEGLRVTSTVSRPPFHGASQVHAATMMQGRVAVRQSISNGRSNPGPINNQHGISRAPQNNPTWQNNRGYRQPPTYRQPAYRQPAQPAYRQPTQPTYRQPTYRQPTYRQPTYRQPARQSNGPARSYSPPRSTSHFSQPSHSVSRASGGSSHSSGGHSGGGGGGGHHR